MVYQSSLETDKVNLSNPDIEMVPALFALNLTRLSWGDVYWAYNSGIFGWYDVIEIAKIRLVNDINDDQIIYVDDLSKVDKNHIWKVGDLLKILNNLEPTEHTASKNKFLFLCLAWIYKNKERFENPFDEVELVYADFNYPDEIVSFIPFMPAEDCYDPGQHTIEENNNRLYANWYNYLSKNGYHD